MDVIAMHQAGFTNTVAGLGTALTEEQAHLLSRYASEVLISYDCDEAGQKAAARALNIFRKTAIKTKVLRLSGGKDPDEILKKYGPEKMKAIITGAANEIEFKLLAEHNKYDLSTDDGKRQYLKSAAAILATLSPIELDIYASRISDELSVSKRAIIDETKRVAKIKVRTEQKREFTEIQMQGDLLDKLNTQRKLYYKAAKAEEMLIALIMANPEFLKSIDGYISPDDFVTEFNGRIYSAVTERISDGSSAEISFLRGKLTDDELNAVAKIQTVSYTLSNTLEECRDCINVILNEKTKKSLKDVGVESISDEDFVKFFKK